MHLLLLQHLYIPRLDTFAPSSFLSWTPFPFPRVFICETESGFWGIDMYFARERKQDTAKRKR